MERYVCIHGHFYQPPRENPWLESIELQDPAYPYHDWNERITAECYAVNAVSRILDSDQLITQIASNYSKISFNFGPTLLSWLEIYAPEVYSAIIEADHESQQLYSGHGSALAQPYNHMIMPLATKRDKYTQVVWGIRDFQHRFGRDPEGMWLPETAVDIETLETLAESGIKFTILAPRQAQRVRQIGKKEWQDVNDSTIDPTMAYSCRLPSNRNITLFFYDDLISRAVAFEGLLSSGEQFAQRIESAFSQERNWPQIVNIATDGETYGHHHRHGDMALAYALNYIETNNLARITNYGEYLESHPPEYEVEIIENTSWSCVHGVERWRNDCGCNSGRNPRWNQSWRAPLREALDWLRNTVAPKYEEYGNKLFKDPWVSRDDYIQVILNRSIENIDDFLVKHSASTLDAGQKSEALKLLELQRHAMLMYTSCGWFFDELSCIEAVQIVQYAGRVVQLAHELFGDNTEAQFLERLEKARSNIRKHGDGRRIYDKFVKPAMIDLNWVAAHYAVSSLFEEYGEETTVHCYIVKLEDYQTSEVGRAKLAIGNAEIFSEVTWESSHLNFGVLHFGDHNLNAGVQEYKGKEAYQALVSELTGAFSRAEFPEVIRLMDKHLGTSIHTLRSLFKDEQRKVLGFILESTLAEVEAHYRQIYETNYPLMLFVTDLGNPLPRAFQGAAELILNTDLQKALTSDSLDIERIAGLLNDTIAWEVEIDTQGLSYLLEKKLESMMEIFSSKAQNIPLLQELIEAVELASSQTFEVNLWSVQNIFWAILQTNYIDFKAKAEQEDKSAKKWIDQFNYLGKHLSIRID
jgi:alpha-amylase/alpha-mannosidase (GH57 family)